MLSYLNKPKETPTCKKTPLTNKTNSDKLHPALSDFLKHKAPVSLSTDITLRGNCSLNNTISTKLSILLY